MTSAIISTVGIEACFETLTALITSNLAPASRRIYEHTFRQWCYFAAARGIGACDMTFDAVNDFVNAADVGKSTRQNRLSHIRKALEILAIANPDEFGQHYALVKAVVKVKPQDGDKHRKRNSSRALNAIELRRFLDVWADDTSDKGIRNHALVHLAVFTGLRRSELADLRWDDVNLESATVTVRAGKGDKSRVAVIADSTEATVRALKALHKAQGGLYEFLFPKMTRGRTPKFGADEPGNSQWVMVAVSDTGKRARIGHISPHDQRRTHITTALDNGAPLADMQAQAGHADAATTLRYAKAAEAKSRKARIQF